MGAPAGAVLAATAQYPLAAPRAERVVSLCADHGQNYASTIYQDAWLAGNGLLPTPTTTWPVTDITLGPARPLSSPPRPCPTSRSLRCP